MRALLGFLVLALNTVLLVPPLLMLAFAKLLLPWHAARAQVSRWLVRIAESWIGINSWLIDQLTPTRWTITGLDTLRRQGWYLVISNHQSWVDIPVLQKVFNRRIPFLKFFLKQQLIWVPFLGAAWWALDFPFMRRYSRAQIERNPELAGRDIEATRKACQKFRTLPVSIMNFVEGTRFSEEKKRAQQSPFHGMLKPKAGGVAFVLEAMGDMIDSLIDVRIDYPGGRPDLFDLLGGRVPEVRVQVREIAIPKEFIGVSYANNAEFRIRFQAWLNQIWQEKERLGSG